MNWYWTALILAIPAFAANMAPIMGQKFRWLRSFDEPLDFNGKLFGKRILGDHKTIRGVFLGILGAVFVSVVGYFFQFFQVITLFPDWQFWNFVAFGFLAGSGALFGDALESFCKRRIGIRSGQPFIPFDQIDYILGFLLSTSCMVDWMWQQALFLLLFALVANPLANLSSYLLGIKKTYW